MMQTLHNLLFQRAMSTYARDDDLHHHDDS